MIGTNLRSSMVAELDACGRQPATRCKTDARQVAIEDTV